MQKLGTKALLGLLRNPLLVSRIPVLLIAAFAFFGPTGTEYWNVGVPVLNGLARWDSAFYLDIGAGGYNRAAVYVFRPLYPLILAALSPLLSWMYRFPAEAVVGFFWNIVAMLLAGYYLKKLTSLVMGPDVARTSLMLLAAYPSSFFLSAIYPQATELLFVVTTFYFLERRAHLYAGLCGFLAGLTTPEGFLVFLPLLLKGFSEHGKDRLKFFTASVVAFASLPVFLAFSYFSTGSPFTPLSAELLWEKSTLFSLIPDKFFSSLPNSASFVVNAITMVLAVAFLAAALNRTGRTGPLLPYYIWASVLIVGFLFVGDVRSWARFTIVLVPLFWSQARYSLAHRTFSKALFVSYASMMVVGAFLFSNWYPML